MLKPRKGAFLFSEYSKRKPFLLEYSENKK
jgi:hypothetical protein